MTRFYVKLVTALREFKEDQRGVTAIEYGLIAAAMATLLIGIFAGSGDLLTDLTAAFTSIADDLTTAAS